MDTSFGRGKGQTEEKIELDKGMLLMKIVLEGAHDTYSGSHKQDQVGRGV